MLNSQEIPNFCCAKTNIGKNGFVFETTLKEARIIIDELRKNENAQVFGFLNLLLREYEGKK